MSLHRYIIHLAGNPPLLVLPFFMRIHCIFNQIDFTSLSSANFSKHRTKIYEIVALIWIDDYYDNYLQASENVYT